MRPSLHRGPLSWTRRKGLVPSRRPEVQGSHGCQVSRWIGDRGYPRRPLRHRRRGTRLYKRGKSVELVFGHAEAHIQPRRSSRIRRGRSREEWLVNDAAVKQSQTLLLTCAHMCQRPVSAKRRLAQENSTNTRLVGTVKPLAARFAGLTRTATRARATHASRSGHLTLGKRRRDEAGPKHGMEETREETPWQAATDNRNLKSSRPRAGTAKSNTGDA